jgi:hypothetical protein
MQVMMMCIGMNMLHILELGAGSGFWSNAHALAYGLCLYNVVQHIAQQMQQYVDVAKAGKQRLPAALSDVGVHITQL